MQEGLFTPETVCSEQERAGIMAVTVLGRTAAKKKSLRATLVNKAIPPGIRKPMMSAMQADTGKFRLSGVRSSGTKRTNS